MYASYLRVCAVVVVFFITALVGASDGRPTIRVMFRSSPRARKRSSSLRAVASTRLSTFSRYTRENHDECTASNRTIMSSAFPCSCVKHPDFCVHTNLLISNKLGVRRAGERQLFLLPMSFFGAHRREGLYGAEGFSVLIVPWSVPICRALDVSSSRTCLNLTSPPA